MKLKRWSWGYVPVIVVLGLIWYEFWQSGAFAPLPAPPADTQAAGGAPDVTVPPAPAPGAGPVVIIGPGPTVPVTPVTPAPGPEAGKGPVLDDAFFANPPGITVSCKNASVEEVIAAMHDSFKMPSYLQFDNSNGGMPAANVNIEAKNAPFWTVIKTMQAQTPLGFIPAGQGNGQGQGLILSTGSPVYRFEVSGPAILYAQSATYMRNGSGQRDAGEAGSQSFNVTLGAAVDPRILVARPSALEVIEATDENGRPIAAQGSAGGYNASVASNTWSNTVTIPPLEPLPRRLNLKCQLRFAAQLPTGSATLEDASQKVGEQVTLGDRQLRLTQFDVQGSILRLTITSDNGMAGAGVNLTVIDASGRTTSMVVQPGSQRAMGLSNPTPPFRLVFRDPAAVRELSFPFELKDIPLP